MKNLINRNPRAAPWIAALVSLTMSALGSLLTDGKAVSDAVEALIIAIAVFAVVRSMT